MHLIPRDERTDRGDDAKEGSRLPAADDRRLSDQQRPTNGLSKERGFSGHGQEIRLVPQDYSWGTRSRVEKEN